MLEAMIRTCGFNVTMLALHNVCSHGDIFNMDCPPGQPALSEGDLERMFSHYDGLIEISHRIAETLGK